MLVVSSVPTIKSSENDKPNVCNLFLAYEFIALWSIQLDKKKNLNTKNTFCFFSKHQNTNLTNDLLNKISI